MEKIVQGEAFITQVQGRSHSYHCFVGILASLPDPEYYDFIYSAEFKDFLNNYQNLRDPLMMQGINDILSYLSQSAIKSKASVIDELAVDRTAILRAPYSKAFKPPHESMYTKASPNSVLLSLKKTYSEAGFMPKGTSEAPDFLCVQLDFMRMLNQQILAEPSRNKSLLQIQQRFIQDHLEPWVHLYCREASKNAETLFYKGLLQFLTRFIHLEAGYLAAWR